MAADEGPDELSGGDDHVRRRPWTQPRMRGVLAPVGVLAVLALVLLGLGSGHRAQPPPTPDDTSTATPGGDARTDLVVDGLCTALTERDTDLLLTFRLLNRGAERVVVDAVEASLPLGGLQPLDVGFTTGDCLRSVPAAPGVSLDPSEAVRVTFLLRLPAGCAAPYPVAASIDAHTAARGPSTTTLLVLPDLGSVPLPHCGSAAAG